MSSSSMRDVPEQAATIVRRYRRAVSATRGKSLLSVAEKQAHIDELSRKAQDDLDRLRSRGQAALSRSQPRGAKASGTTSQRQLSETRKQRAWDRLKPLLDASSAVTGRRGGDSPDTMKIIQDAAADGDSDTLAALHEELPSYLSANRLDMYVDVLPVLLGTKGSSATPVESDSGWKRVESALAMAEHAIASSGSQAKGSVPIDREYQIPAFTDGETIVIEGVEQASQETDSFGRPAQTTDLPQWGE